MPVKGIMKFTTKKLNSICFAFLLMLSGRGYAENEQVNILYEEKIYLSSTHPVPLIKVTVQDIKTKVILDTAGSGAPFLSEKFVKRAKIITQEEKIPSFIFLDKKIRLELDALSLNFPTVGIAQTKDRWFDKENIAGLFNPVILGPSMAKEAQAHNVILDFLANRFYVAQAPDQPILDHYFDKQYAPHNRLEAPLRPNRYYKLIIEGSIQGREGVPVLIDSGASSSAFDKSYLKGIPPIKQTCVRNFGGKQFCGDQIAPQFVLVNGKIIGKTKLEASEAPTDFGPPPPDNTIDYQGLIGMDLLKNCALVIASKKVTFYCKPS